MATTEITKFETPAVPDQKKADALIKSLQLATATDGSTIPIVVIRDEDDLLASAAIVTRHDEVLKALCEGDPERGIIGFDPFVSTLHNAHKMACQLRSQFINPILASKQAYLRGRMLFTEAKEAAQKKIDDAAAEAIQKAQAKELVKDAKKLEKRGDSESAAVLREQAANVPLPSLPPRAPMKQAGFVVTGRWKYEIENADDVPREYCEPSASALNKVVTALGNKIKIPGVRIWYEKSESSRGKR